MLKAIAGSLFGAGLFLLLQDGFRIPTIKSSKAVKTLSKKQSEKTSTLDLWLGGAAKFLSRHLRLNEFKREELWENLQAVGNPLTPEQFRANAIVKAGFVSTVEKTLKHSRDVLAMIEGYIPHTENSFRQELQITAADMRSGNQETAVTRLEARVASPQMSDVCRGLIGILHGDAEGYIDVCIAVVAVVMLIVLTLNLFSFLNVKIQLDRVADELIEVAEYDK